MKPAKIIVLRSASSRREAISKRPGTLPVDRLAAPVGAPVGDTSTRSSSQKGQGKGTSVRSTLWTKMHLSTMLKAPRATLHKVSLRPVAKSLSRPEAWVPRNPVTAPRRRPEVANKLTMASGSDRAHSQAPPRGPRLHTPTPHEAMPHDPSHEELVERAKVLQKQSPECTLLWHIVCDEEGKGRGGYRDPAKQSPNFLSWYLEQAGTLGVLSDLSTKLPPDDLVKQVQELQRSSKDMFNLWREVCGKKSKECNGTHDPRVIPSAVLQYFLDQAEGCTRGKGPGAQREAGLGKGNGKDKGKGKGQGKEKGKDKGKSTMVSDLPEGAEESHSEGGEVAEEEAETEEEAEEQEAVEGMEEMDEDAVGNVISDMDDEMEADGEQEEEAEHEGDAEAAEAQEEGEEEQHEEDEEQVTEEQQFEDELRNEQDNEESPGPGLVQLVKDKQRRFPVCHALWVEMCDSRGNGRKDPARQSAELLKDFIDNANKLIEHEAKQNDADRVSMPAKQPRIPPVPPPSTRPISPTRPPFMPSRAPVSAPFNVWKASHSEQDVAAPSQDLVEAVKDQQRSSAEGKRLWAEFCEKEGNGIVNPAKHSDEFLRRFLGLNAEQGAEEQPAEDREDLLREVKQVMYSGSNKKEKWEPYCKTFGGGTLDPRRHPNSFLRDFLDTISSTPEPEAVYDSEHQGLVEKVHSIRCLSPAWHTAWHRFCGDKGIASDPAHLAGPLLRQFLDEATEQAQEFIVQASVDYLREKVQKLRKLADGVQEWNWFCKENSRPWEPEEHAKASLSKFFIKLLDDNPKLAFPREGPVSEATSLSSTARRSEVDSTTRNDSYASWKGQSKGDGKGLKGEKGSKGEKGTFKGDRESKGDKGAFQSEKGGSTREWGTFKGEKGAFKGDRGDSKGEKGASKVTVVIRNLVPATPTREKGGSKSSKGDKGSSKGGSKGDGFSTTAGTGKGNVQPASSSSGIQLVLAEQVKQLQRGGPVVKEDWDTYCKEFANGICDPKKHEAAFLRTFLARWKSQLEPASSQGYDRSTTSRWKETESDHGYGRGASSRWKETEGDHGYDTASWTWQDTESDQGYDKGASSFKRQAPAGSGPVGSALPKRRRLD